MAETTKRQLTDEEKIERKARIFRTISRILIVITVIAVVVLIYFTRGAKENISQQTSIDTQPMRSKLKQIVALEKRYKEENGDYIGFGYLQLCKELRNFDPAVDGSFKYKFDPKTGTATGMEKDASNDVNGDVDGNDGLTLTVNWEPGVVEGSAGNDFFWTKDDLADFEKRKAEK